MKKRVISLLLALLLSPIAALAATDPQIAVTSPSAYKYRKALFFPLDAPSYAIRAITWPIGAGLSELEKWGIVDDVLDFLSNKEKTFWVYPIIEGGAGTGFGGGVGLKHSNLFHKGYTLGASYRIHINMDQTADISFGQPKAFTIAGKQVSYRFINVWNRTTNFDYYGIGNSSSQSNHAYFGWDDVRLNGQLSFELIKRLTVTPFISADFNDTRNASGASYPGVQTVFAPTQIRGFDQWFYYFNAGLRLGYDSRNNPYEPYTGGIYYISFKRNQCLNQNHFNYNEYVLDLKHYLPLWRKRQLFVLHANITVNQTLYGNDIPFWRLAMLDATSPLRGFSRGRFRDRGSILGNIEYRYPIWRLLSGTFFFDTGRVFHSLSSFSFDSIKFSGGGGFHIRVPDISVFRFELGYGGEGLNIMFGTNIPL